MRESRILISHNSETVLSEPKPFDDILDLIQKMPSQDVGALEAIKTKFDNFPGPKLPIGNLEMSVKWLAGWQGKATPSIDRPLIAVFAGTHGVAADVIGKDSVSEAKKRISGLTQGSAGVRGISASLNAAFKVYEMGVEHPCNDIREAKSLTERECAASIAFGMEVVAEGADIIALGNAGFGSATAAAAIARGLYGGRAAYWAGGDGSMAERRVAAVASAANFHRENLTTPLDVLKCFGGRDIAGTVGAIIAARHQSIPVILDGYVVCAAAAVLHKINPDAISHCIAGHLSSEPAHGALLDRIGKRPLLDLKIGMGDGTGAAFALGGLRLATEAYKTLSA